MDDRLGDAVSTLQYDLRYVIETSVALGIPAPAFMVSLAYFDTYRSEWMPANLIQAQRDYFGAHTYERIDERGAFHTSGSLNQTGAHNHSPLPTILIFRRSGRPHLEETHPRHL